MARVTVEDCVDKVPNRFELVLVAAHRARALASGSAMTVEPDNDKRRHLLRPCVSFRHRSLREELRWRFRWYRLVGPDEFDMAADYVSMDSPLGRSLLGKRLDDEVTVTLPAGAASVTIAAIEDGLRPPERS